MFGKTHSTKTAEVEKKWLVIDAEGLVDKTHHCLPFHHRLQKIRGTQSDPSDDGIVDT